MSQTNRSRNTENKLADALLASLEGKEYVSDVPIRDLTAACGLDRQTFYYHFKNIHELAEFTCNRELDSIIGPVDDDSLTWELIFNRIGKGFESHKPFYNAVATLSSARTLHRRFVAYCRQILTRETTPALLDAGYSQEKADDTVEVLSCAIAAVLAGWMTGCLDFKPDYIAEVVTDIRNDYLAGVAQTN